MPGGRENDLIVSEIFTEEEREEIRRLTEEIAQAKIPRQLRKEKVSGEIPVGSDVLVWDSDRGKWSPTSAVRSRDIQLTNAQVLTLATSAGVELIAAPGADKTNIVDRIHIVSDASDTAWTEPSAPDDLVVQYADGVDISGAIEAGALIAQSVNVRTYGMLDSEIDPDVNAAVMLFNSGSNWGGGNVANTMSIRIWYSIAPTVAFS